MQTQTVHQQIRVPRPDGTDPRAHPDALSVLMDSQDAIRRLMQRIETVATTEPADLHALRSRLARRLCLEIAVQLQVEEELLLPRLRGAFDDPAPAKQALVEHSRLCRWVARLLERGLDKPDGDERARTLGLLFTRHLRREVLGLHALAREADLDWQDLGQQIQHRRNRLLVAGPWAGAAKFRNERRSCS